MFSNFSFLLGCSNWSLAGNAYMNPWVHLQTISQNYRSVPMGTSIISEMQVKDFYEKKNFPSIILVDDLSAELTLEMQEKILERLFESKSQVFLTALNDSVLADILYEMDTNVFHVEHGEIA